MVTRRFWSGTLWFAPCFLRWKIIYMQCRRPGFDPWLEKIPWRRAWLPTPVCLPGEFHEQRSLTGYSPRDHKESDMSLHRYLTFNTVSFLGTVCLSHPRNRKLPLSQECVSSEPFRTYVLRSSYRPGICAVS